MNIMSKCLELSMFLYMRILQLRTIYVHVHEHIVCLELSMYHVPVHENIVSL